MNLMEALLSAKLGGSGGGSADVTAASVLAAMQAMTNTQEASARTAIAAQTAVVNVVTDFGAVGDGTTDDAAAIQSALDAGGVVYFPAKIYKIETALKFDSNMILLGEPGATILQGADINNLLRNKAGANDGGYTATSNVRIIGLTFDGGAYTVNNTLLAFTHTKNISIEHCAFRNGYGAWHDIEINSSSNVTVKGCSFDGSRRASGYSELVQIDALNTRAVYPFEDEGAIDSTPCKDIIIDGCKFIIKITGIGHHNTVACDNVKITNCLFSGTGEYIEKAGINLPRCTKVTIQGNTFTDLEYGVRLSGYASYSIIANNTINGGTKGIRVRGGGNIVASNTFSGITSPVEVVQSPSADQNINDGNLVTGNRADTCTNDFLCENGIASENYFNGVYSGVFEDKTRIVTDTTSTSISITPAANAIYKCGELASLTISNPTASGAYSIVFTSGSTATTTTIPATILGLEDFVPEANTIYEINVLDNRALVAGWPVSAAE